MIFIGMAKIIISERQYKLITKHVEESIDPNEAYNNESAMQTVLDGRRGIAFLVAYHDKSRQLVLRAKEMGFNVISMPQKGGSFKGSVANVVYRNGYEEEAQRLFNIVRKNNGFLPIKTPEETYEIGILLDYDPEKVKEFVLKNFPNFKFY
jgi:hypothetical protein